jgi:hypothetical protein
MARKFQNDFGGGFEGKLLDETAPFQTLWKNPEKRDRLQELQSLQIERTALNVPLEMLWQKAGYSPDEIEAMQKMEPIASQMQMQQIQLEQQRLALQMQQALSNGQ